MNQLLLNQLRESEIILKIEKGKLVTLDYVLIEQETGDKLDSSEESGPLSYIHGNGGLLPCLERELEGRIEEEKFFASFSAEEAYGKYDSELVMEVPITRYVHPEKLEIGQQFELEFSERKIYVYVKEIKENVVIVDGNHPLAGKAIKFDVNITEVRDPTAEELEYAKM